MYHIVSPQIDVVVRGGMCTLFHVSDNAHRLSNDIDFLTSLPIDQARNIVKNLDLDIETIAFDDVSDRLPDNLLSFRFEFGSCLEGTGRIKVDLLCGIDQNILASSQTMSPKIFNLDFVGNYRILTKGALMADKITTLSSVDYLGISPHNPGIVKQIYDLNCLLQQSSLDDLTSFFQIYPSILEFKTNMDNKHFTSIDIANNIHSRISDLINTDNISLRSSYTKLYSTFQLTYLRESDRTNSPLNDVFLVSIFAKHIKEWTNDHDTLRHCNDLHDVFRIYRQLRNSDSATLERFYSDHM